MSEPRTGIIQMRFVRINDIHVGERAAADMERVHELADSIRESGLINPITLNSDFHLIAGFHRIQAYKFLGIDTIQANIVDLGRLDAELVQIDENLIRREFTRLERSEMLHRRKELYDQKHPSDIAELDAMEQTTNEDNDGHLTSSSFYEITAAKLGVVPRTIQRDVQIAQKIPQDVRDLIRDMPIANNKRELIELSRLGPEEQRQIALELASPEPTRAEKARERLAPMMSSASPEWYTPLPIIEKVKQVLGAIDLDPCSNSHTSPNVPATRHFTVEDDGLAQEWHGTVYMNPPYGRAIDEWVEKLCNEHEAGRVTQAIALVPSRTDTAWFRRLREFPRCFLYGRLNFSGYDNAAPFPSMIVAIGCNPQQFMDAFGDIGDIYQLLDNSSEQQPQPSQASHRGRKVKTRVRQ